MARIFQIVNGFCYYDATGIHRTLESTVSKYPPDVLFVEAPDYVREGWGYDATKEGEERFIMPEIPDGWAYDLETGTFYEIAKLNENSRLGDFEYRTHTENNVSLIPWEGKDLTVTQATKIWLSYTAEGNTKAQELSLLIANAKAYIRSLYPVEGETETELDTDSFGGKANTDAMATAIREGVNSI